MRRVYLLIFLFFVLPLFAFAETRDYSYDSFKQNIQINEDSTFDVSEAIKLNFIGAYNQGWREVIKNKFDALTDVSVFDAETGKPLERSSKRLNKTDPASWGKFAFWKEKNKYIVEWYYNFADTSHEWVINYKIHGGIGFYKNADELYWNSFTSFERPIRIASVSISLPKKVDLSKLDINFYTPKDLTSGDFSNSSSFISDSGIFDYYAENIPANQPFTIYASWPKGIVSQRAYFLDFLKIYWGFVIGFFLILISIILAVINYRKSEHRGRGVIIPEYEPPQNIPPAMAQMVIKEGLSYKSWPATIVDLAIRGYVEIKEDDRGAKTIGIFRSLYGVFNIGAAVIVGVILALSIVSFDKKMSFLWPIVGFLSLLILLNAMRPSVKAKRISGRMDYIVIKKKEFQEDADLHDYEKEFLSAIFQDLEYFSTREMKNALNIVNVQKIRSVIVGLNEKITKETDKDTSVYEKPLSVKKWQTITVVIALVIIPMIFGFSSRNQMLIIFAAALTAISIWLSLVVFNPYPTREGAIIREKWLGFKLYLKTAEKYRLQNLKPEYFEKYLPYAMIFGVEKEWAHAFESLNIPSPGWYSGNAYAVGVSGSSGISGFSPSGFSQSLSSSFASVFSSASGSGGAGGGGSAGGGGGGGGGGAS